VRAVLDLVRRAITVVIDAIAEFDSRSALFTDIRCHPVDTAPHAGGSADAHPAKGLIGRKLFIDLTIAIIIVAIALLGRPLFEPGTWGPASVDAALNGDITHSAREAALLSSAVFTLERPLVEPGVGGLAEILGPAAVTEATSVIGGASVIDPHIRREHVVVDNRRVDLRVVEVRSRRRVGEAPPQEQGHPRSHKKCVGGPAAASESTHHTALLGLAIRDVLEVRLWWLILRGAA